MFGANYCAEALALFARMTVQPDVARKRLINSTIVSMKVAGLWSESKFDGLYIFAAHDAQAARLNWLGSDSISVPGSPTFTANRGYQGNGSSSYLQANPGVTYAADAGHAGMFIETADTAGGRGIDYGGTNGFLDLVGGFLNSRWADLSTSSTAATGVRHASVNRPDSTQYVKYKNGASIATVVSTSSTFSLSQVSFLAALSGAGAFSDARIAAGHFGTSLTSGEMSTLYTILNGYMTRVGV